MPLFAPPESTEPDASDPTALWLLGVATATTVVRLFAGRMVVRLFAGRMVRLFAGRAVVQRLFAGEVNRSPRAEISSEHEAAANSVVAAGGIAPASLWAIRPAGSTLDGRPPPEIASAAR